MTPGFALALMLNNYLHDVATALLAASGFALWVLLRRYEAGPRGPGEARYFLGIQRDMARLARLSLAWIVLGGIPRTIWYADFEWANAAGRGQVPVLVAKHAVAFALVGLGIALWRRIRARVREIEARAGDAPGRSP